MSRTYSELRRIPDFLGRFQYLNLHGVVGEPTFGYDRYINQTFYRSREWAQVRDAVILRDEGCDLGIDGHEIHHSLIVHHITPMSVDDIRRGEPWILDPEHLITTTHDTHNAIHYGNESLLPRLYVERFSGDTKLW